MTATTAGEVEAAAAETPVEHAEHVHACANCGAHLQGAFCHACGQKGHLHGRLWHLIEEFAEGIAHFDGRLWRTLPLLAFRPGRLSREWRLGRRVRYVAPLHVFLFATFLLFIIPNFTGRHLISLPTDMPSAAELNEPSTTDATGAANRAQEGDGPSTKLSGDLGDRILARVDKVSKNSEYYSYKIESLAYKLSFVIVPISIAILSLLLAFKSGFTLYDHAVVSLYGVGFLTLLLALASLLPASRSINELVIFAGAVHAIVHLRGAYGLSWPGTLIRALFLGLFSTFGFSAFLMLVVALGVMS